jgi:hypothetical protein
MTFCGACDSPTYVSPRTLMVQHVYQCSAPASPHPFVPDMEHPRWCVYCGRTEGAHDPKKVS